MIKDLILKSRSYRRFYQEVAVEMETLRELIDLARICPTRSNMQPLKYILSCDAKKNALIFPHTHWAKYIKGWNAPPEGEKPSAYIIILGDTEIQKTFTTDDGIAAQSILLAATEKGLGGCMIGGGLDRNGLRETLGIPTRYEIVLLVALGKPRETVVLDALGPDGDIKYWRDEDGVHHVPKRSLDDIIID